MHSVTRWGLGTGIVLLAAGWPIVHFRAAYAHHKRFHAVTPGVLYRSGQLTADGFRDVVAANGIRTVINCQNEFPDPEIPRSFWNRDSVLESEVCRELGVRYIHLDPDLVSRRCDPNARPHAIDEFLAIIDDPTAWPVLLHCRAGLHRTGVLVAAYRQEYEGWGPYAALEELKAYGYGDSAATAANDYIRQYVLNYRRRSGIRGQGSGGSGKTKHPRFFFPDP